MHVDNFVPLFRAPYAHTLRQFFSLVQLRYVLKALADLGGCFFGAAPALMLFVQFDRPLNSIDTLHIAVPTEAMDRLCDFVLYQLVELDQLRNRYTFVERHFVSLPYQEKVGFRCVTEFQCFVHVSL